MKAKIFVLLYFKTVKAKRSTQGTEQSELAAKQNELTPKHSCQNKENHSGKTNSANSLGTSLSHF